MKTLFKLGIGLVVLVWLASQCGGKDHDKKADDASGSTSTAAATSDAPAVPANAKFHTEPGTGGEIVFAEFDVRDNFTSGMRKTGAQSDTLDILKYAYGHYPQATRVWVQGHYPLKDDYGNSSDGTVVNVGYDRSTLARINWDDMSAAKIWDIADAGHVHKDLQ